MIDIKEFCHKIDDEKPDIFEFCKLNEIIPVYSRNLEELTQA
jgi:hypothetical protein